MDNKLWADDPNTYTEICLNVPSILDIAELERLNPDLSFGTDGDYGHPHRDTMTLIIRQEK